MRPRATSMVRGRTIRSTPTTSCSHQRGLPQRRRGLPQRRAGHAAPTSPRSSTAWRTTFQAAWMNQTPAVILNIQRQSGANTISVVKSIKHLMPQLNVNLPQGHPGHHAHRPDHRHQGLDLGRRVRAAAGDRAGGAGDLPVPAQRQRHHHPERRGAAVAGRHAGGHVRASATASTTCR